MSESPQNIHLPDSIVKWVNVGIFAVDRGMKITLWNNFMANHSGRSADTVIDRNLFDCFPELPKTWLSKKIQSVFILKNFAFTSWEQRPYLFHFPHNRPITGSVDFMLQNCTFMPVKNETGEVDSVCITLFDATDTVISQTELKNAMDRLSEDSNRDGLTGIYNRRYLEQHLLTEFDRSKRYGGHFSFMLFDLDHFKKINDTHGHLAGDAVLCAVSQRIHSLLRTVDVLGRYGGEEFGVILPSTNLEGAIAVAEKLRQIVAQTPVMYKETAIPITVSIGVTEFKADTPNYEHLIHCADLALYFGKGNGRNRVTRYTDELESKNNLHPTLFT